MPASSMIRTMTVYRFSSWKLGLPPSHLNPPALPRIVSSFVLRKEELLMEVFGLMTKKRKSAADAGIYVRAMAHGSADIKMAFPFLASQKQSQ